MKMKTGLKKCMMIGVAALLMGFSAPHQQNAPDAGQPVDEVNPYMGNISHLLVPTYPTIHLPNSMLRVYPVRTDYTGVLLHGLPLELTSHRGAFAFNLSTWQGDESGLKPVISYSYDQEKLTPYSYSVYLDEQQTEVNFGLSHQSAMYELSFEKDAPVSLVLNSGNGRMTWDGKAVSGWQMIANDTRVYLYLVPEELPRQVAVLDQGKLVDKTETEGKNACLVLRYPRGTKTIHLRYGISFIDATQAHKNLQREVADYSKEELKCIIGTQVMKKRYIYLRIINF